MKFIEGISGSQEKREQTKQVADFLELVTTSPIPVEIATRSLSGEKLFVWVNTIIPPRDKKYEIITDTVEELTTIVAYVQSNGTLFPVDEYGLIAHCDLTFCRKQTGEQYVFTDLKCPPSQYVPPENLGWKINTDSVYWFVNSAMTLERRRPLLIGEPDNYAVGIGSLLNAIGVEMMLRRNIFLVQSYYLSENGQKIWEQLGLSKSNHFFRYLDPVVARAAVMDTILHHILLQKGLIGG